MHILIKRTAARGDVLVAAAVASALKKKYNCTISFCTSCQEVLYKNIYIDNIVPTDVGDFDKIIDLDLCYEKRPHDHILQCYADTAEIDRKDCRLYLHCSPVNMPLFLNYVTFHAGTTNWVGRNWQKEKMTELAVKLHDHGLQVVCVGAGDDHFVPCDVDTRNSTTVSELATIISNAKCHVGIDSLPFQIAQAVNTPSVIFFGSIDPSMRIIRPNVKPIRAKSLPCLGCHHRKPAPSTVTNICETGTLDCEKMVTVDEMLKEVMLTIKPKLF